MSDKALSQCLDLELAERSAVEVAAAYRALCGALLLRTASAARSKMPPRKIEVDQRRTALAWAGGRRGVITFEEACDALDMRPERAREAIERYACQGGVTAISKAMLTRKPVERNRYAPADVARREIPPAHGVASRTPDVADDRNKPAWA